MPLPVREFRRLELNASELGVPVSALMQNAGRALAATIRRKLGRDGTATFYCGKGNNGGDGLVAAVDLLRTEHEVRIVLAEPASRVSSPTVRAILSRLPAANLSSWAKAAKAPQRTRPGDVLVDCLLGSGLSGTPRPPYDAMIARLNRAAAAGRTVISCDVPSGLGTPLAVRPAMTVAFHAMKEGMSRANSGNIQVAPIGIPPAARDAGIGDLDGAYRRPRHDSHKGDNGVILFVGGSIPYTGAPFYAGMAAYRTGVDLVHAILPSAAASVVRSFGPHIMVHDGNPGATLTTDALPIVDALLPRATALVLGCGMGSTDETRALAAEVLQLAASRSLSTVVDADGLDALTPSLLGRFGKRMVLTPHSREFLDLAGFEASEASVKRYAQAHGGVTILWKHQGAFISDGTIGRKSRHGHPTMTVGGTGDVLAGAVGAILAKGAAPFEAACAGAYLVGSAGEVAASLRSWGATATDVAEAIPSILLRLD
jgi:hydroxyethylthiazole kinase-like uncharacterized protein yjeF